MIVSIHQPNYFPWLGYFYKIFQSDVFVFLDDVQFSNEGMHNYHYIKTPQGSLRLKIPVEQHMGDLILDVKTKDHLGWKDKHLKTVEANYKKTVFFAQIFADYQELILKDYKTLSEMNISIVEFIMNKFGINTQLITSSELKIESTKEEKVMDICNALQAATYYSGTGAKAYQNESDFVSRGLELKYSVFHPFEYEQLWNEFQSNVTVLDYLMNCGYDWQRVLDSQKKI
jgi:hypothetical protein